MVQEDQLCGVFEEYTYRNHFTPVTTQSFYLSCIGMQMPLSQLNSSSLQAVKLNCKIFSPSICGEEIIYKYSNSIPQQIHHFTSLSLTTVQFVVPKG